MEPAQGISFTWSYAKIMRLIFPEVNRVHPPVVSEMCVDKKTADDCFRSTPATEETAARRRGYRIHIRHWMKSAGLKTVAQAAKRLGVSESTLKSIMTDKGQKRYSDGTLQHVLDKTSYNPKGPTNGE